MTPGELAKYADMFLKIAVQKCGNLDQAQELCQETLLAALVAIRRGTLIDDPKAWLSGTMNHKYYDALRRKYKLPTVSIDDISEVPDDSGTQALLRTQEAEDLRRRIAFLAGTYREVIVRHYLAGESVAHIAAALGLPQGTVKSRLSTGRTQIKKGIDTMEPYTKQSYQPQVLHVSYSGSPGINGEPSSLTADNLIVQNLLILAYEKPVPPVALAQAIGIPTAYVEPIIERLVAAELMTRAGGKVYTDFIIYFHDTVAPQIESQKKLVRANFNLFWQPLREGLDRLQASLFYDRLAFRQQRKLDYHFLMHAMRRCFFDTGERIYGPRQELPDRSNGGKWIAIGHCYPQNFCLEDSAFSRYSWSGERVHTASDHLDTRQLSLRVFDTPLENPRYFHTPHELSDDTLARMLYSIDQGIPKAFSGVDSLCFQHILHLEKCGVVTIKYGIPAVGIPMLIKQEYATMEAITQSVVASFSPAALPVLTAHLQNAAVKLPTHLQSVPEQQKYLPSMLALNMAVIYQAMKDHALFADVDFPCPPMILVVDKD